MKRHSIILRVVIGLVFSFAGTREAAAQEASSFEQLQVLVGSDDEVTVTEADGKRTRGRIIELSPSSLHLSVNGTPRRLNEAQILEIRQHGPDPIGNGAKKGALIGLGFGAAMGALRCAVERGFCALAPLTVGIYSALGAGIGAGVDALRKGERTVYRAPVTASSRGLHVTPVVGRDQKGLRLSIGF